MTDIEEHDAHEAVDGLCANPTDLFLALTPERVLDAVEAAGLRTRPVCMALNSFENRVYDVGLEDDSHVVAKFYRPGRWTRQQILEEHGFIEDLEASEIPVCGVRPFPSGDTLASIEGILYCVHERKGGRAPQELDDEMVERLGMLTARLHNVGARRPAEHRLRICADVHIRRNVDWLMERGILPDHVEDRYVAAALDIADILDDYMRGVDVHRIHGDLHLANLIVRGGLLHLLDFDDMVMGPAVQDLWLLLPGRDDYTRRQRELFVAAYEQIRAFDRTTLRLIEPLRGLRYVHYATWLARRWHDPIFPLTWPQFGTEAYWEQEMTDLEEQLQRIRSDDPTRGPEVEEEPELGNKDLFWDWEG